MEESERIFTQTFLTCISRFAVICSFREIAHLGLPYATARIYGKYLQFANELFSDPQHENLFIDKEKALKAIGSADVLGTSMAQNQIKSFEASVDATSLIFAHSILDGAALGYCKASSLASPTDWEQFIEKRKVSIEEIRGLSYEEIIKNKINDYINCLDRESLLVKIERLFQVCRPPTGFSPIHNYCYDRVRLEKLDEIRHEIVHGTTAVDMLPKGEDDIWFLQQTANFLMGLVNKKYNLKINL